MILLQFPLFVAAFAAVTDLFYVSSLSLLWWRAFILLADLAAWIILCFFSDPETAVAGGSARSRAIAVTRSQMGYFLVPTLLNAVIIAMLIPQRIKFADLWPLTFVDNVAAFAVLRSIQTVSVLAFLLLVGFWYSESRHARLHIRISKLIESSNNNNNNNNNNKSNSSAANNNNNNNMPANQ